MKKLLLLLFTFSTVNITSFSVVGCMTQYNRVFNSILNKIETTDNIVVYTKNISNNLEDISTIFAIKNAMLLTLSQMSYVSIQSVTSDKLQENNSIQIQINVNVEYRQKTFIKSVSWAKDSIKNSLTTTITDMFKLRNNALYLGTNNGLYATNNGFVFNKMIIKQLDNCIVYDVYQTLFGEIYLGTNIGLFTSLNLINFTKLNIEQPVYQIIEYINGYIYLNLGINGIDYSTDNGLSFQQISNLPFSKANRLQLHNDVMFAYANEGIFYLDNNLFIKDNKFKNLTNVNSIYWISKTKALIGTSLGLWYYNLILNNICILKQVGMNFDGFKSASIYSIIKVKKINSYFYVSTNHGIFYSNNTVDFYPLITGNDLVYSPICSYYPYIITLLQNDVQNFANTPLIIFYQVDLSMILK